MQYALHIARADGWKSFVNGPNQCSSTRPPQRRTIFYFNDFFVVCSKLNLQLFHIFQSSSGRKWSFFIHQHHPWDFHWASGLDAGQGRFAQKRKAMALMYSQSTEQAHIRPKSGLGYRRKAKMDPSQFTAAKCQKCLKQGTVNKSLALIEQAE